MWTAFKFWFASQITVKSWGRQVNGTCTGVGTMIWMPNLYSNIESISWGTFWVACTPGTQLKCHPCQSYSLRNLLNDAGLPKRRSFSSRLASLLSRRSCFSISALIRLDSFASSLRQQAIMESKVITAWAEKPVWQGEPGYTSHKMSQKNETLCETIRFKKFETQSSVFDLKMLAAWCRIWPSSPMLKLLSSIKYLTA